MTLSKPKFLHCGVTTSPKEKEVTTKLSHLGRTELVSGDGTTRDEHVEGTDIEQHIEPESEVSGTGIMRTVGALDIADSFVQPGAVWASEPVQKEAQRIDMADSAQQTAHKIGTEANNNMMVPFEAYHSLMVTLQSYLEHAIFEYAKNELPTLIQSRQLRYPQQIELHQWPAELRSSHEGCHALLDAEEMEPLYRSICDIRNMAVHRTSMDWKTTKQYFRDSQRLMNILQLGESSDTIGRLLTTVDDIVYKLAQHVVDAAANLYDEVIELERQKLAIRAKLSPSITKYQEQAKEEILMAIKSISRL
ncbi:hypothetical protein S40288_10371 [Stachybotrys chartarum IBT 40288]|nr:hypothetical protein S40288_10371 [Stachybotrys chartarum IBT 40288]